MNSVNFYKVFTRYWAVFRRNICQYSHADSGYDIFGWHFWCKHKPSDCGFTVALIWHKSSLCLCSSSARSVPWSGIPASMSKGGQGEVVPPFPVADQTLDGFPGSSNCSSVPHISTVPSVWTPQCVLAMPHQLFPSLQKSLVEVSSSGSGVEGQMPRPQLKNCLKDTFDPQQQNIALYKKKAGIAFRRQGRYR